eukprot:TRINITY_DN30022_c0_g2_i1.p1 TRINITY_DN30022_c0_g2~~TRINITY_DN30022_c0_g2_i1.p1  ORF type:complete len:301 (-),score=53.22 TRINITY_DN30022_c0_g2_i1:81-983(-)
MLLLEQLRCGSVCLEMALRAGILQGAAPRTTVVPALQLRGYAVAPRILPSPPAQLPRQRLGRVLGQIVGGAAAICVSSKALASCDTPPKVIKVFYGDMPFWRAECIRMTLFLGGVNFEDVRDKKRDDLKAEGKLTFGATPVLEVDGKMLSQTQAMAAYCSRLAGLHPDSDWGAAKVDEAINGCTDVTMTVGRTFSLPAEEKVKARQELIKPEGRLSMHLGGLEKLLRENGSTGYAVGDSITVADLAIWRLIGWIGSGVIDGIPKDYVSKTFPEITKLCATVDCHPKVQEWKALHAKFYQK